MDRLLPYNAHHDLFLLSVLNSAKCSICMSKLDINNSDIKMAFVFAELGYYQAGEYIEIVVKAPPSQFRLCYVRAGIYKASVSINMIRGNKMNDLLFVDHHLVAQGILEHVVRRIFMPTHIG